MLPQEVLIPFLKVKVPVVVDLARHPAIECIARWGPELKRAIEEACFANYRNKLASVGPESLPHVRRANEVWKQMEFREVRIDPLVNDTVVLYVVPAWDIEEHLELCVRGTDELVYVGQFLGDPVDAYGKLKNV
jgi:PP-loop superfamily ATP-utilizing enzyme